MSDDSYQFPKPGKVYVSPSLRGFRDKARRVRIASKVTGLSDGYEYAKEHGEVVLRDKPNARTCIRAKFLEATGDVFILTIQKFDNESGMPYGTGFTFVGEEMLRTELVRQSAIRSYGDRQAHAEATALRHRMVSIRSRSGIIGSNCARSKWMLPRIPADPESAACHLFDFDNEMPSCLQAGRSQPFQQKPGLNGCAGR